MKLRILFYLLSITIFICVLPSQSFAQTVQKNTTTDAAQKGMNTGRKFSSSATGPRSSPWDPLDANDHQFVTDSAPKLDTGCIFRSSGPIIFNIAITRYVGPINSDGTLIDPGPLVKAGLLSKNAFLSMPAFDVDFDAQLQGIQPERDRVFFNGFDLGFLTGANNVWKLNGFNIPIEKLKFPDKGSNGVAPTPAMNEVRIDIDTANPQQEAWCTEIDWGAVGFDAVSPIILIHGNNSKGLFFDNQHFTDELKAQYLLYDNSINLVTSTVADNARKLNDLIPKIVTKFGVDSVHLVAHSKGGLDAREYLANYQPSHNKTFKVLSLTTLSTPHNGSVSADLLIDRDLVIKQFDGFDFSGFPLFTPIILSQLKVDAGTNDLTTSSAASFNAQNVSRLSSDITFNTISADADVSGNKHIDRDPDEYLELRQESDDLRNIDEKTILGIPVGHLASKIAVDDAYLILRRTASITITSEIILDPDGFPVNIATITSNPNPTELGNDVLVTIPSGQGQGLYSSRVSNSRTLTGSEGRNHSNVANAGVAKIVIPWILEVERKKGDLKD